MESKIAAYQRAVISSIMLEEYIESENNEKLSWLEKILKSKTHLFTPVQVSILKKAKAEIDEVRSQGCYECWIMNEAFIDSLNDNEKIEFLEIISTGALPVNQIETYISLLQKNLILRKVI